MKTYTKDDLEFLEQLPTYTQRISCAGIIENNGKPHALIILGHNERNVPVSCHIISVLWLEQVLKQAKGEQEGGE